MQEESMSHDVAQAALTLQKTDGQERLKRWLPVVPALNGIKQLGIPKLTQPYRQPERYADSERLSVAASRRLTGPLSRTRADWSRLWDDWKRAMANWPG